MSMDDLVRYYGGYNEDARLGKDNVHRVELLTTVHYLDRILEPRSKVLDVAAGTGSYAFYLAAQGHEVTARDIVPAHVTAMEEKANRLGLKVYVCQGDARNLEQFRRECFDAVLCMGPVYHLKDERERARAVGECVQVLRRGGFLAIAYVNRHAQFLVRLSKDETSLGPEVMDNLIARGRLPGAMEDCFYFSHPQEIEALMAGFRLERVAHLGTDGIGYLLRERINALDEAGFQRWLRYQLGVCEDPWFLGYSLHGLYIGRKQ